MRSPSAYFYSAQKSIFTLALSLVCGASMAADRPKIVWLSFGDYLETRSELSSQADIEQSFRKLHDAGFTHVYWRMLWEGQRQEDLMFFSHRVQAEVFRAKQALANTPYPWDPHEIRWPIEIAHRLGMRFYAAIVVYKGDAPPNAPHPEPYPYKYPYGAIYETQYPFQSKFNHDHPQYQLVDREGKRYHHGILEWAYPQARAYWVANVKFILDNYDVDGIYIDTRSECMSPDFADQYGFNEPIVKEYQRRFGVNILEEDFDLGKWRDLRGEYFTLLLKEMSDVIHGAGKLFSMGTARGDYIGFPLGNMKLQWRKWITDKIIDELQLNVHGWAFGKQGYGYVTDFATNRGLKPFETSISADYGPLCKKYGVRLYFGCNPPRPRPLSRPCCWGRATPHAVKLPDDWCRQMAAMPEFDGTFERPPF
jgi:hypothetical protein